MTPDQKAWIDGASHYTLLAKWRFAPAGEPIFQGEAGDYYKKIMAERRDADPGQAVENSKAIGW